MLAEAVREQRKSILARAVEVAPWVLSCAVILAFFVRYVVPGYRGLFAVDDPMNLDYYWAPGPWALVKGLLLFFSTYERPLGGVYYMVLYRFFGLNPLPYHIVVDALVLVNCFLVYRFARLLSCSPLVGGLTALMLVYHRALTWIVYRPSFIFDTLCFTFFFLTLNYYISIRRTGARVTKKQAVLIVLLYIGALDSKEMAVSLPLVLLAYECIWNPPDWRRWRAIRYWLGHDALWVLVLGAITAAYVAGHTAAAGALTKFPAYRPVLTLHNFAQSNMRFINELFLPDRGNVLSERECLLIWGALLYLAWRRREKQLWFAAAFVLITPLPICFVPGRGGGCLYILMAGWALAVSTLLLAPATLIKAEPPFRRVPLSAIRATLALVAVSFLWNSDFDPDREMVPSLIRDSQLTWSAIQQLKALQPTVPPHTRILFLKDPFEMWDMKFIADLVYHDRTVAVWLEREMPGAEARGAWFDMIFTWDQGHLVRLKPLPVTTAWSG